MTEKHYQKSVDVWSLGVILSELIYCSAPYVSQKGFKSSERYLFKGTSSYPISPKPELKGTDNPIEDSDQIFKIMSRF